MKTLGIIGGMGPVATQAAFKKLIQAVPAKKDSEHPKIVVLSYPQIPDRVEAISHTGPSPVHAIVKAVHDLEKLNVDFAFMSCITAHHFFDEIQNQVSLTLFNVVAETMVSIREEFPYVGKIGILATTSTIRTKIFDKYNSGAELLYPDEHIQEQVTGSIFGSHGIKSLGPTAYSKMVLQKAADHLKEKGADIIIAGCTEIPLALSSRIHDTTILDPMEIVAKKLIMKAMIPDVHTMGFIQ